MSLISVKNLNKSFGNLQVLKNLNVEIEDGERVAIIGGSGCGKSVFLRSLELLERPDSGQIFIDGEEITAKKANINKIRRKMGMVYQKFCLFAHMNVLENLCLAPVKLAGVSKSEAKARALEWLSKVGLTSKMYSMPANLSGGQQQRIAICRCLMMNPKVLLLDEPTSALDPTMVGEVLAMIRLLTKQNLTMLIVTHEMNFARDVANRVLFFADGGIYEEGTPEKIFDNPEREKTIAFIRKLKFFNYEIKEREFDLMALQGGVRVFAEKYDIKSRLAYRLQLCSEELIYEMLNGCYKNSDKNINISLEISYDEANQSTILTVVSGGNKFNPFDDEILNDDDDAHLALHILKNISSSLKHEFIEGKNYVEAIL